MQEMWADLQMLQILSSWALINSYGEGLNKYRRHVTARKHTH